MTDMMKNVLTVRGKKEDVMEFLDFLKQGNRKKLDFNLFIPMPSDLKKVVARVQETSLAVGEYLVNHTTDNLYMIDRAYGDTVRQFMCDMLNEKIEDDEALMQAYLAYEKKQDGYEKYIKSCKLAYNNFETYGYADWFDWRMDYWGTKWNAENSTRLDKLEPVYDEENGDWGVLIEFQTADYVPMDVVENMVLRFTNLSFVVDFAFEIFGENTGILKYEKDGTYWKYLFRDSSKKACEHALMVWGKEQWKDKIVQDDMGLWYVEE